MSEKLHIQQNSQYGLRPGAEEFPLMIVLSIVYPCNFGCPHCPYSDGNSEIRRFYHDQKADQLPQALWNKIADEAGPYGSFLRCTGGGEPFLHPRLVDMLEYAKGKGCRVWVNTNGSMFGPNKRGRDKLERCLKAGIELIEFSMDAGDAQMYDKVRPPITHDSKDPIKRFNDQIDNIRTALQLRKSLRSPTRIVVSMIRQELIQDRIDEYIRFYSQDIGVDEVITRKFLSWDDNTLINLGKSSDPHLYKNLPQEKAEPCVWPFERLNVDTLGRIALCGQDIAYRTANLFPTLYESTIKDIWLGETFNWYRQMHLEGRGAECFPCRGCSAWLAGIRDWQHGWLKVLKTSGHHLKQIMKQDVNAEVLIYEPDHAMSVGLQQ
jgi:organic radical activating enzyme